MEDKRFYVYLHRQLGDHRVFYVGKGTNDRLKTVSGRSSMWWDIVDTLGFYWEVYKDNLTEKEAFEIERDLISNPNKDWILINSQNSCVYNDVPNLSDYFDYDETSKTCLRWKNNSYKNNHYRRKAHKEAGYENSGRYKVCLDNKEYMVHRIIMVLHGFDVDGMLVNHIDCNPLNNKIENLELATHSHNNRNKKNNKGIALLPKNTSGVNGVRETVTNNGKDFYAHAFWYDYDENKTKNKFFPYNKYGKEEAWRLAISYREEIIKNLWGENTNE